MPSDRHEALHLVLGFLKDNGLNEAYRTVCWEAGVDASVEELAPHVSLMRILLDWKRAFEARFQGTPRIIQPVHKPEPTVPIVNHAPLAIQQPQHQAAPSYQQEPAPQQTAVATTTSLQQPAFQLPGTQSVPLGTGELNNGNSLQTISYMPGTGNQLVSSTQPLFRSQQSVQLVQGQGSGQVVLAQPQQLGSSEINDQQVNGLRPPAGTTSLLQTQRTLELPSTNPTGGLPPRAPGVMASHSSSLYSPHEAPEQDCSQQHETSPDWQPADEDGGMGRGNSGWLVSPNNSLANNNALLQAGRRSSGGGANLPPVTKMKGSTQNITQDQFLQVINSVGPGASAAALFEFRRPQRGSSSSARRSAILQLDDQQHDAMYALAGCEDVNFLISNVQGEVRVAMHKVFGIDKESFTVWFKNRGRNPSKTQYAGAYTGKNGMKRARQNEMGYD